MRTSKETRASPCPLPALPAWQGTTARPQPNRAASSSAETPASACGGNAAWWVVMRLLVSLLPCSCWFRCCPSLMSAACCLLSAACCLLSAVCCRRSLPRREPHGPLDAPRRPMLVAATKKKPNQAIAPPVGRSVGERDGAFPAHK
jgi:hypothetical protein